MASNARCGITLPALDAEGMPIRMWDAEDREVALGLDEFGRVRSATALPRTQHAATTTTSPAGRPLARTDALGNTWRFRYDRLGRLEETTDPVSTRSRADTT